MTERMEAMHDEADFDPFAGPALVAAGPTTEPQREIWTACRFGETASLAFNESCVVRMRGALDTPALARSHDALLLRHEALRATVSPDGMSLLVAAEAQTSLELHDWRAMGDEERGLAEAELLRREVEEPFDLEKGPLFRAQAVRLTDDETLLVFTAHHIVCDGWSAGVILRDWAALYSAEIRGGGADLPPAPAFTRYAAALEAAETSPQRASDEAYWLSRFGQPDLPVLDLPTDRPRPALKTYNARREDVVLDAELVKRLKTSGARAGASLFSMLLAGFDLLLHRLTG